MKWLGIIGVVTLPGFLAGLPAFAHDCDHHSHHSVECWDCGHPGYAAPQARRNLTPSAETASLRTVEGKIAEVVYLYGATPDSGMVEIRVQAAGQAKLVRLAPLGFLKQGGMQLREGDTVVAKGFPVSGMEGDLIVATELRKGDLTLSLRDAQGRPAW